VNNNNIIIINNKQQLEKEASGKKKSNLLSHLSELAVSFFWMLLLHFIFFNPTYT